MQRTTGGRLGLGLVALAVAVAGGFLGLLTTPSLSHAPTPVPSPSPRHHLAGTRLREATLTASLGAPVVATASDLATGGYWQVAANGAVVAVDAPFFGSMSGQHLNEAIVGMAATHTGRGYWEVASDGGIFTFGNAAFHGSMGGRPLNRPIVGIAADPATGGYWEVASDGGIFAFDAPFLGSMGAEPLNSPVVGIVSTSTGAGYWEVASDGGIFTYGNAAFHGSMGGHTLARPIVQMTADPATGGYWEVASDGGIFAFDAPFFGSTAGHGLATPVVSLAATPSGGGYREVTTSGSAYSFGTPQSLAANPIAAASPGAEPTASGAGAGTSTTGSGAYEVVGNKILEPNGQQFVPYGFVLNCLAEKSLACLDASKSNPLTDSTLIRSAASFWHADVVRLQVAPENLFINGSVNQGVLTDLTNEVELINSLGMVAIITDQEEEYQGPPLPTALAVQFWQTIASSFKSDPAVFFDLYNEPRITLRTTAAGSAWSLWRNGGVGTTRSGATYDFVGMQTLVDDIRALGAQNIVVAEGINVDKNLSGIPRYALTGSNIAYGMEPDLNAKDGTPAKWAANWGELSQSVPIMMEAFQDWPGAGTCNPASPTLLPQLFSYLQSLHLGLIVWTLAPGILMIGDNPSQPTTYGTSTTAFCTRGKTPAALASNTNGPGQLIDGFFTANSRPVPTGSAHPPASP